MKVMITSSLRILPALMFAGSFGITFGQSPPATIAKVPVVTVCEALSDLSGYNGKTIIVVGRFGHTSEGSWLSEDCESKLVVGGKTWDDSISTSYMRHRVEPPPHLPKGFKWDRELLKNKLKEVQKTTKLVVLKKYNYKDKWLAMFGRFENGVPIRVMKIGDREFTTYGFGHLNSAPAQLVWAEKGTLYLKAK